MREKSSKVLVVAVLAVTTLLAGPASAATLPADVRCIAHRGGVVAGHTEETIPTYSSTLADFPDIEIEGDIRWGRTGYPMLLHNATLDVFGAPTVELESLSVGQAKAYTASTGDEMASLYELRTLLLAYPGARAQLELKETMTPARWTMLESRLDVLGARVTLTSFSLATVRQAQDEGYRTGLLSATDNKTTAAPTFIEQYAQIDAVSVAAHRAVKVKTQAYTPDTPAAWDTLAAAGVTAVITNQLALCRSWSAGTLKRRK